MIAAGPDVFDGTLQPTLLTSGEEAAVRSLYGQMMDCWHRGNGAAFGAPCDEESDFIAAGVAEKIVCSM
jgi:hypothetical protein